MSPGEAAMSVVERFAGSWRRLLLAGWVMFAVSFVLPAAAAPPLFRTPPPPPPPPAVTEAPDAEPGQPADTSGPDEAAERLGIRGWEAAVFAILLGAAMSSVGISSGCSAGSATF